MKMTAAVTPAGQQYFHEKKMIRWMNPAFSGRNVLDKARRNAAEIVPTNVMAANKIRVFFISCFFDCASGNESPARVPK